MPNISLKQLEAFVQISRDGSFRKAAERLNTTQPNISVRIANLENQIGKALMERDAGSVRLTHTGEKLLPKAYEVLASIETFKVTAENSEFINGSLRLGVTETIAHSWLSDFLDRYSKAFKNVTIELIVDLSANLTTGLANGSIDLALQSGPFQSKLPGALPLGKVPLVWVASPSLGIGDNAFEEPNIRDFAILTHSRNTLPFKQLEKHFTKESKTVRLVPSSSLAACLHMTLKGLEVTSLPNKCHFLEHM